MAKKKDKPLYDEDGRWVEERGRIKGAVRRAFRLSPQMKETLQAARVELPPALKKDGTPGKRPVVRYKCAMCGDLFSQKNVQVDHIETVVPLWKKEEHMTYDEIVRGVFCKKENLQVLCSTPMRRNNGLPSCHKKKTDEENWVRRQLMAFLEGEGLVDRDDVDFKQFVEPHKEKYKEYLEEKERKKNERAKRRKTKKR